MRTIPLGASRHKAPRRAQHRPVVVERGTDVWRGAAGSGRQVEAMTAEQTEVVSQNVAVEFVAKLSAERTTANATNQPTDDGAGN